MWFFPRKKSVSEAIKHNEREIARVKQETSSIAEETKKKVDRLNIELKRVMKKGQITIDIATAVGYKK